MVFSLALHEEVGQGTDLFTLMLDMVLLASGECARSESRLAQVLRCPEMCSVICVRLQIVTSRFTQNLSSTFHPFPEEAVGSGSVQCQS